jgi:5-methylcytosine-specific restriction endonuclease McrA
MMLPPRLQERLATFLPEIRVGIDFGESAGGIAVVKGNQILHAETYVDFHASDLEQRRQLRRGRRTRHAKKMRLARLRSWVLRQKLPDDTRLPDPYVVMRDPKFHVQPGVFKTKTPGRDSATAPSWIDLAKQGKVNASGFVRALTLIFQKRGFKWDAIELAKMTDEKMKDFLQTARVPSDNLASDIREEIQRRRQDPDSSVRGKKKVSPDELLALLEQARERHPQPRVAEHRTVKEADLRSAVEGFGNSINLTKATIQRWQRELSGLLNKVLRPARFENRLRTGCAWCGKPTPRKIKVRELAYEAAVRNLRVREGRSIRPLKPEELAIFAQWWHLRGQAGESQQGGSEQKRSRKDRSQAVPKLKAIQSHLKKIGAQEQMARQIFDLLWNEKPQGRASLCHQHLIEAAQGRTMKDVVGEWHKVKVRKAPNPCREQHDVRVLHRLEQILFKPGKNGPDAWRYGPAKLITLEVPKPQTEQARKGEQKLRKPESFMERLRKETAGVCMYCDSSTHRPAEDKDHIFPQSRGGPDVWDNLVPVCRDCNMAKGDRTPFEWIGAAGERWQRFTERVEGLAVRGVRVEREDGKEETVRISERKRALLISQDAEYPDNPTPLAHVGARPRQFVVALRKLFEDRGVAAPSVNFESGLPFVQRIDGRTTFQLRKSWLKKANGSDNFPKKNDWDLLNHAQDAALIAACPPHTWRDTVFRVRASRPRWDGKWTEQDGLAVSELAPDWAEYLERQTWPLIKVLGRYPVSWKRKFADLTFSQNPDSLDDKRLVQYLPIANMLHSGKGPDDKRHPAETEIVNPTLDKKFRAVATALGIKRRQTLPEKNLREEFPGIRHVKVRKQPGGRLVRVEPEDGPPRKVEVKGASEAIVFWVKKDEPVTKLRMSIRWPTILRALNVARYEPTIPSDARILAVWRRYQLVRFGPETGLNPGFYRVKEFDAAEVRLLPESAIPDALAQRLNLKRRNDTEESAEENKEIKLRKPALAKYFETLNEKDRHDPRTAS